MTSKLKHTVVLIFCSLMISAACLAQTAKNLPGDIITATGNADSELLSSYFNDKIELITPEKSGVYSKYQAEQVIKSFFESHPVTGFKIIHQGVKDDSSFAIGIYTSGETNYRFYFRIKDSAGKTLIQQLWIENQDE